MTVLIEVTASTTVTRSLGSQTPWRNNELSKVGTTVILFSGHELKSERNRLNDNIIKHFLFYQLSVYI